MNNDEIYENGPNSGQLADGCMDWNDTLVKDDPDYILLPEGDYVFEVLGFERCHHAGSEKIPPCNKARLTLQVKTPEGVARVYTDLLMHKKLEWKISSFFRSVGRKQKGEHVVMDWEHIVGARGRAHIAPRTYPADDGERSVNDVKKFLDYDPEKMPAEGFEELEDDNGDLPF